LPTLGYSRQSNRKAGEGSKHPDRNDQFEHINTAPWSLTLDARRLDDWPPLLDFSLVIGGERLRILILARRNLLADINEPLADA
jgi:hypothetical protein